MQRIKFNNGLEMYNHIAQGIDLYSKTLGVYIFLYNDAGALCTYELCPESVAELIKTSKEYGEGWSSFLGVGGQIYDDIKYNSNEYRYSKNVEQHQLYIQPSLDLCNKLYNVDDWVDINELTNELTNEF